MFGEQYVSEIEAILVALHLVQEGLEVVIKCIVSCAVELPDEDLRVYVVNPDEFIPLDEAYAPVGYTLQEEHLGGVVSFVSHHNSCVVYITFGVLPLNLINHHFATKQEQVACLSVVEEGFLVDHIVAPEIEAEILGIHAEIVFESS